jgi:poly(A) polymerase
VAASAPPRLIGARWLARPDTQAVFAALGARGFAARAVGGAVRDALMGRPVADVDIATDAHPEQVMRAAEAAGLKAVPTGLAHGTVTVVAGNRPFEVTTLRKDVETHGRHATVAFTDDWTEDARRRDFTLNALYCRADGQVYDPLSGYPDLVARRVRFIGVPAERIREDYLRILRFFRQTADYGEGPADAEGLAACVRERAGLGMLSGERVREELLRLLARLAALEGAAGSAPDAILRLGALTVEIEEDAERLRERLRLSNEQAAELLRVAVREPKVDPSATEAEAKVCLYRQGQRACRERVLIAWARSGDPPQDEAWRRRLALPERWQTPVFPLGGADVLAEGVPAGPRVGALLRTLEDWWIAGDFSADEAALRAKLKDLLAET